MNNSQQNESYGTRVIEKQRSDDFDDIIGGFDDGGGGNARCAWDGSVCQESVTHQITQAYFETVDAEPETYSQTYCPRHYAVELVRFATFHEPECPISIRRHFASYGLIGA